MTIQRAIDNIQARLAVIEALPEQERDAFSLGQIQAYQWSLEEVNRAIASILPHEDVTAEEEAAEEREADALLARFSDENLFLPFISPARYSSDPCLNGHRDHAYQPNSPARKLKRCIHCGDVQPMSHGEKIRFTRTSPKPPRAETAWAE